MRRIFVRMRSCLVLLVLFVPSSFAQQAAPPQDEIVRGLKNLQKMQELGFTLPIRPEAGAGMTDPWGTPYRIDGDRIVSAGNDKTFDESSWTKNEQFTGAEGDVVVIDGELKRSNRTWLHEQITSGSIAEIAKNELHKAEARLAALRSSGVRDLVLANRTWQAMRSPTRGTVDAWGTAYRVDDVQTRVVSAGADKKFDTADDIVVEQKVEKESPRQDGPPPLRLEIPGIGYVGQNVTAPVLITRVEPKYARQARISGFVVLEIVITETGEVEPVRILRGVHPSVDDAALDAVRKWTFRPATVNGVAVPVIFAVTVNIKP
jgi:TonB family protein